MKQKYLFKILTVLFFGIIINTNAQTQGDIAFVGFNADGDDDFAIVLFNFEAQIIPYQQKPFWDLQFDWHL